MPILPLAALVLMLQAPVEDAHSAGLVADAGRLAASATNEERFDALTALLRARTIAFAVEPFTIPAPVGKEPRTEGRNIVVTLGQGSTAVVVGAHYDAARLQDGTLSKGAVDNAASSVLLVRLAEAMQEETLPFRLRIVWFDMEELGLLGSARYAERHRADNLTAMINFDINAYGDTVLFGPWRSDNRMLRRAVAEACGVEDVPCMAFEQMPPGDDRSFLAAGIPNVSVAMLPALEAHQLWLMLAGAKAGLAPGTTPAIFRTIHSTGDVPSKVNGQNMAAMLRFAGSLVRAVGRSGASATR
jgi:hypothetical protein